MMCNANGGAYESATAGNWISIEIEIPTQLKPQSQIRDMNLILEFLTGPANIAQFEKIECLLPVELQQ